MDCPSKTSTENSVVVLDVVVIGVNCMAEEDIAGMSKKSESEGRLGAVNE